ncbi:uncharacterized protein FOMMEDRAFT_148030 [Fomitiporia mediterranea MF3/22]|uniref:uncharacterized protein n=1 Tax=Fomitiporia mediterranea (strain MF3/22) TaxID=694068 RepID=UPI0004408422|nr:uncharacterized protein FOMMEDRAFT_148030 [Fomitiporia mediterranea MF3/22]EJD01559.1 hypothetical protein FOMMEDRAFT_148030 [Fomitiporia mediterranea MF3/22]
MSFSFQWPRFSDQFHENAIQLLNNALNKGNKPPVIADRIEVVELEMGTQPPELEIRDIGDLTMSQFRGIFRLTYAGDAHIVLRTKVQANPLYHKKPDIHLMGGSKGMVAANQPLIVPMLLRLSNFKLNSYVVLVVSKQKGITLVFKTDPLQNVDINSTFDSFTVIQKFIQKEIEGQLRQMFREDLPSIIHRLSQQWIKKSTTVEAPYLAKRPAMRPHAGLETMSNPDFALGRAFSPNTNPLMARRGPLRPSEFLQGIPQRRSSTLRSVSSKPSLTTLRSAPATPQVIYDQETGTFKTEIPESKAFSHLGRIHRESRGLADLAEEESEYDGTDGDGSFDVVDWDETMTDILPPRSEMNVTEYESIPAVGGGMITRPRVYHASSLLHQTPSSTTSSRGLSSPGLTAPALHRLSQSLADMRHPSPLNPYMPNSSTPATRRTSWEGPSIQEGTQLTDGLPQYASSQIPTIRRTSVEDELDEFPFENTASTPPLVRQRSGNEQSSSSSNPSPNVVRLGVTGDTSFERAGVSRRSSVSSQTVPPFATFSDMSDPDAEPKIILRPGINNAVSQLSLLNRSNQTLSPYTRPLQHFMIRSVPPRMAMSRERSQGTISDRQPVKAKRKRVYRLGGKNTEKSDESQIPSRPSAPETTSNPPQSPSTTASDFDATEIDRYFRSRDEYSPRLRTSSLEPPLLNPAYLRRRSSINSRKL